MGSVASIVEFKMPDDMLATIELPFKAVRMFTIFAPQGTQRGKHAHKQCSQFMVSVYGDIGVLCESGPNVETYKLYKSTMGLFIPPMTWTEIQFETVAAVMVLCDRLYEADDYIRSYSDFVRCPN